MSNVMHVSTIAGRTALTVITPDDLPVTNWMENVLAAQIQKVVDEGKGWPNDAEFKVEVTYHTCPQGWDREVYTHFFTNRAELDSYIKDQHEWARCEDNMVKIKIYNWDLGPNFMETREFGGPELWNSPLSRPYLT